MVDAPSSKNRRPAVWHEANRSYLVDCLAQLRRQLAAKAGQAIAPPTSQPAYPFPLLKLQTHLQVSLRVLHLAIAKGSALQKLCQRLYLTPFEVNVLLLCAGAELEATWGPLCAAAQADPQRTYPTFGLALALFPNAHWSALTPAAPLRRWQLTRLSADQPLTSSPLRIDERILHYLLGLSYLDETLASRVQRVNPGAAMVPSHAAIADQITQLWQGLSRQDEYPAIQLCGPDRAGKQAIAAATCQQLGLRLYSLSTFLLPPQSQELQPFLRRWQRESWLTHCALLIDDDGTAPEGQHHSAAITHTLENVTGPVFISNRDRRPPSHRVVITFDVGSPTSQEQRQLWHASLGDTAASLNGYIDALVSQFDLTAPTVAAIGRSVAPPDETGAGERDRLKQDIWAACRSQARPRMEDLAQPITSRAHWDDLVLPAEQKTVLKEIAAGDKYEQEADEIAGQAVQMKPQADAAAGTPNENTGGAANSELTVQHQLQPTAVQRQPELDMGGSMPDLGGGDMAGGMGDMAGGAGDLTSGASGDLGGDMGGMAGMTDALGGGGMDELAGGMGGGGDLGGMTNAVGGGEAGDMGGMEEMAEAVGGNEMGEALGALGGGDLEKMGEGEGEGDGPEPEAVNEMLGASDIDMSMGDEGIEGQIRQAIASGGEPLSEEMQAKLRSRIGLENPEDIRVHTNGAANDLCDELGALAFTTGNHIFFAAGEYDPDSPEGQELIFHEAVHTIQQGAI